MPSEAHVAHGYFLNSFVSPIWNKRDDEYGCQNVENRTRIVCAIIGAIREACGPDFVIGCRLNGCEYHPDLKGITPKDAAENAKAFVSAGAQYISVAGYGYGPTPFRYCPDYFAYPDPYEFMEPYMGEYRDKGLWTSTARTIKDAVDVPVMTAGRMDEDLAERVLEEGDADIIAFGSEERCGRIPAFCTQSRRRSAMTRLCVAPVARAAKIALRNLAFVA